MKRAKRESAFRLYTGGFLLAALVLAFVLGLHKKLPIQTMDGYWQHYTVLGYIQQAVRSLLRGKGLSMNSPYLGQGLDVLTTLSYYGLTDPLNLLSALFPQEQLHVAYIAIAALRLYLSGLAFLAFSKALGIKSGWGRAAGALLYATCGFALYALARHTYFINGMLYLPLMLLGVERVLQRGRWSLYALTAAVMLLSSFYFAFINTLLTIAYILLRLLARARERGLSGTAKDGALLLAGYLLGALLASWALAPVLLAYLDNARLGVQSGYAGTWHYELRHYVTLAYNAFLADDTTMHWVVLALSPMALFGALSLPFARGRAARTAGIGILLSGLGLCFPLVGKIMNAGGYVVNRWCYALSLFLCLGAAAALPRLAHKASAARRWAVALPALLWGLCCLGIMVVFHRLRLLLALQVVLAMTLALVYGTGGLHNLSRRGAQRALAVFLLLMTFCQLGVYYDTTEQYPEMFGYDIQEDYLSETPAQLLDLAEGQRVEFQMVRDPHALIKHYRGTGYYWSLVPARITEYYRALGAPSQFALAALSDLGGSAHMEAVASTGVYIPRYGLGIAPWGFEEAEPVAAPDGTTLQVWENRYALPFGVAFDGALSEEAWRELPVERRIQALTACAIADTGHVPAVEAPDGAQELAFTVEEMQNIAQQGDAWRLEEGASVTLRFSPPADGELWLIAEAPAVTASDNDFAITAETKGGFAQARFTGPDSNFAFDRPVVALCLGGSEKAGDTCRLTFSAPNEIRFESLRLVSLPMAAFRQTIAERRLEAMTDVSYQNDRITGHIAVGGDRVLQLSLPYSTGWRATVDGQPAELFPSGGMYTGLALAAGEHDVVLTYRTPGLAAGCALSGAGLLGMIALGLLGRRRRQALKARPQGSAQAHQQKAAEDRE